mmetsp:Transcript_46648/g.113598  ORF Transcript_46648/g.113598 Transcript_46648/m.113598 type:complete len:83 (+) Transcript_46648:263-511(+)|eukprot:CAMPEP_0206216892 /NCGR_PEP_ID=MMETSP0047_2-20121206/2973_1 /ASSEMBLY_ACC=CAM_ASM_000192 /TAXON_ID=195065 /ORGANISM="Chroomonas mesostigmatica_cf, Strain CCMP1168" /LENGTH=82 /DNA_ID=CAMNT_0053639289 /DNA_START=243 /DNA_END=491 /DNA_ORIENTATION=+
MWSLLYILDSSFHLGLTPASPTALAAVGPAGDHTTLGLSGNEWQDGKGARLQMLAARGPGANPPPTNPTRPFELMCGGSWRL